MCEGRLATYVCRLCELKVWETVTDAYLWSIGVLDNFKLCQCTYVYDVCQNISKLYFRKWFVIFEIFENNLIQNFVYGISILYFNFAV